MANTGQKKEGDQKILALISLPKKKTLKNDKRKGIIQAADIHHRGIIAVAPSAHLINEIKHLRQCKMVSLTCRSGC